jgi:hypothetical protein
MSPRRLDQSCAWLGCSRIGSLAGSLLASLMRSLYGSLPDPCRPPRIADNDGERAGVSGGEISITINHPRPGGHRGA